MQKGLNQSVITKTLPFLVALFLLSGLLLSNTESVAFADEVNSNTGEAVLLSDYSAQEIQTDTSMVDSVASAYDDARVAESVDTDTAVNENQENKTDNCLETEDDFLNTDSPSFENEISASEEETNDSALALVAKVTESDGWHQSSDNRWYYVSNGEKYTGWLVDSQFKGGIYGLQRYWLKANYYLAIDQLISEDEAGWWAYARPEGYVVRGYYCEPDSGYIYLANNDGKLENVGWVVSNAYGQGLQRYYIEKSSHSCVPGMSTNGYAHYTTEEGYVLRGTYDDGAGHVYLANNDGALPSTTGWLVTGSYTGGNLERYWIDETTHAALTGFFFAENNKYYGLDDVGYVLRSIKLISDEVVQADNDGVILKTGWIVTNLYNQGLQRYWIDNYKRTYDTLIDAGGGWYAYARSEGYVVRGYYKTNSGLIYLANNDGCLESPGWVISNAYGQGLQRYHIDETTHAASIGFFNEGGIVGYGTSSGYVLRGKLSCGDGVLLATNDGILVENLTGEGWFVTDLFDGELQRYRIDYSCSGHLGAHIDKFTVDDCLYYGIPQQGYVLRNGYIVLSGNSYYANNDGVLTVSNVTLNGIDISSWQSDIDIYSVDAQFIIVKATEGTNYTNPYFINWANQVLNSGKMLGIYHFATGENALDEADYFINTVSPFIGKALLFLDWEADALSYGVEYAKTFLDEVWNKTSVQPLIYMSQSVTKEYDWSSVAQTYGLWVARYASGKTTGYQDNPQLDSGGLGAWDTQTVFQYSSNGRIDGYTNALDLNKFYGGTDSWMYLARKQ